MRKLLPDEAPAWVWAILFLLVAGGVGLHAAWLAHVQGDFCIDDAYISFRYAENLGHGLGPVFNLGERVEGYTNFGWVVLMALVSRLGLPVEHSARALSCLSALGLLALLARFIAARSARPVATMVLVGGLLVADGSLARWSQDGMETVFFALLLFAGASLAARERERPAALPWSALAFAVATLVRPEGLLFFATSTAFSLKGQSRGRLMAIAGLYLLVVGPYFLWRWSYYGFLLPNTFYAKVGATSQQGVRGLAYLWEFFGRQRWPLLLLAPLVARGLGRARRPPWAVPFAALVLANALYALLVGGDWMGTGRFLVPTLAPLYATLGCLAVAGMAPAQSARSTLRASVLLSLALSSAIFLLTSWRAERAGLEAERPNLDSRAVVALWLRQHAAPQDTLLSNEIGQLAYFSRLHTEDLHGLTDSHIAHLAVATMGAGKPGHEKLDLAYSLAKHPTWICVPGLVAGAVTMRPQYPDLEQYEVIHISDELPLPPYADLLHRVGSPIEALPGAPQPRDP